MLPTEILEQIFAYVLVDNSPVVVVGEHLTCHRRYLKEKLYALWVAKRLREVASSVFYRESSLVASIHNFDFKPLRNWLYGIGSLNMRFLASNKHLEIVLRQKYGESTSKLDYRELAWWADWATRPSRKRICWTYKVLYDFKRNETHFMSELRDKQSWLQRALRRLRTEPLVLRADQHEVAKITNLFRKRLLELKRADQNSRDFLREYEW